MERDIEILKARITEDVPNCVFEVDAPDRGAANWWVDVRVGKRHVILDYRQRKGFGIYRSDAGYGEGPSEVYRTPERTARRVSQLLVSGNAKYQGPTLKDLRELYECSQVRMAELVGVKQSAISRFEQRSEFKIGTLAA